MNSYLLTFKPIDGRNKPVEVNLLTAKKTNLIYRAVDHKFRQKILKLIDKVPNITVTEMRVTLRVEQGFVSHHLGILRRTGFVTPNRNGKNIHYTINKKRMIALNQSITILSKHK